MGVIIARGTSTSSATGGGSGAYTSGEKLAMELEMEFKAANLSYFKELGYTSGDLTSLEIYTDTGKGIQLFGKTLSYDTSGNLANTLLTRITDSAKVLKVFSYDGDSNLASINVSAG